MKRWEKEAKTVQHLSVVVVQRGNPVANMPPHCMLIYFFCSFPPIYLNFLSSLIIHFSIIVFNNKKPLQENNLFTMNKHLNYW